MPRVLGVPRVLKWNTNKKINNKSLSILGTLGTLVHSSALKVL